MVVIYPSMYVFPVERSAQVQYSARGLGFWLLAEIPDVKADFYGTGLDSDDTLVLPKGNSY